VCVCVCACVRACVCACACVFIFPGQNKHADTMDTDALEQSLVRYDIFVRLYTKHVSTRARTNVVFENSSCVISPSSAIVRQRSFFVWYMLRLAPPSRCTLPRHCPCSSNVKLICQIGTPGKRAQYPGKGVSSARAPP
jgi:hypothetical protein